MKRTKTKWISGPGGVSCLCCRIGSTGEAKRMARRVERRSGRIQTARDGVDAPVTDEEWVARALEPDPEFDIELGYDLTEWTDPRQEAAQ